MNYNNLSLDTALSREFSKMGMTVKGLKFGVLLKKYYVISFQPSLTWVILWTLPEWCNNSCKSVVLFVLIINSYINVQIWKIREQVENRSFLCFSMIKVNLYREGNTVLKKMIDYSYFTLYDNEHKEFSFSRDQTHLKKLNKAVQEITDRWVWSEL